MAYFSNSSEGAAFEEDCAGCPLNGKPCPVWYVQNYYNYEACNVPIARAILNDLVKQKMEGNNEKYIGCQMKPLLKGLK